MRWSIVESRYAPRLGVSEIDLRKLERSTGFWSFPRFLVLSGLVAVLWASLASLVFRGAQVQLESPFRYIVGAIGVVLIVAGLAAFVVGARAEEPPIEKIKIDLIKTTDVGLNPKVQVSGHVTPKKKGVNVFILRENLADRAAGTFSLAKGHATTDDNGYWKHPVALWSLNDDHEGRASPGAAALIPGRPQTSRIRRIRIRRFTGKGSSH